MKRSLGIYRLVLAALCLNGCAGWPGASGGKGSEGHVSSDFYSNVQIAIGGRTFVLQTADGKPLGALSVYAAGHLQAVKDGKLSLPESALREAKQDRRGFFIVLADGYVPRQVWIGQQGDLVTLSPRLPVAKLELAGSGGVIAAPDRSVSVTLPSGLMHGEKNQVSISTYVPALTEADQQAFSRDREAFLEKARKSAGLAAYRLAAACTSPEAPLPCGPLVDALGMLIAVDGPITTPGTLTVAYDLAVMLRGWDGVSAAPWTTGAPGWTASDISRAQAAARLLRTFRQIAALGPSDPLGLAITADLATTYGLSLSGTLLTFNVALPSQGLVDTFLQTTVVGVSLLGVALEVTVVNALTPDLPPGLSPLVVPLSSAQVTVGAGGGIISNNGGAMVGDGGVGLISNNGGALIGKVKGPMASFTSGGGLAKWRLASYAEAPWPGASLTVENSHEQRYAGPVMTDALGDYRVDGLPFTAPLVFLKATGGAASTRAISRAPESTEHTADLDAATTAITCYVLDEIAQGRATLSDIVMEGYARDTEWISGGMSQADADMVVTSPVGTVASFVRTRLAAASRPAFVLPIPAFGEVTTMPDGGGALLEGPMGLARDLAGDWIVAEQGGEALSRVPALGGPRERLAGSLPASFLDGAASGAKFSSPQGVAVDSAGRVYLADRTNNRIRRYSTLDGVTTIAGDGTPGADDGPGASARFWYPFGIAIDAHDQAYVSDRSNHTIRKIDLTNPNFPVTTVAGQAGEAPGFVDGPGASARFNYPDGLAVDALGAVYVADRANHRLRKISPDGAVSTIAGSGVPGETDGRAEVAQLQDPHNVTVDSLGYVFFTSRGTSTGHHRIRVVTPGGWVLSVAGAGKPGHLDGPADTALFNGPYGLAVDADNNVIVTDGGNNCLRRLNRRR